MKKRLTIGGLGLFAFMAIVYLVGNVDVFQSYRLVPAVIIDAKIATKQSTGVPSFAYDAVEVRYKYVINGLDYESDRFMCSWFWRLQLEGRNVVEDKHNRLMYLTILKSREGVYAWVNEGNPRDVCLFRNGFRFLSLGIGK